MSDSYDLDDVDRFVCGAVGPPGQRVFFLQAATGHLLVTLKLEKQQVALLADYLDRLLVREELPRDPAGAAGELTEPLAVEWVVGSMMVAVNELTRRVVVIARELVPDDEEDGPDADVAELRVALTPGQVVAFVDQARELMEGGRPACRLCGRPIDPEGHACPRWN